MSFSFKMTYPLSAMGFNGTGYFANGLPPIHRETSQNILAPKRIPRRKLVIDPTAKDIRPLLRPDRPRRWIPGPKISAPEVVPAVAYHNTVTQPRIVVNADGSPSRKRPAEDSELELVAAVEGVQDLASPIVTSREGNTSISQNAAQTAPTIIEPAQKGYFTIGPGQKASPPNKIPGAFPHSPRAREVPPTKNTHHETTAPGVFARGSNTTVRMIERLVRASPINKMITTFVDTLAGLGEKVFNAIPWRRFRYRIAETRTYINENRDVSNKRVKLSLDPEEDHESIIEQDGPADEFLHWIVNDDLGNLLQEYRTFRRSLRIVRECAGAYPDVQTIERTMKPLHSALVDGTGSSEPLELRGTGVTGLAWTHLLQNINVLDEVYDPDLLDRLREAFEVAPMELILEFSPQNLLVVERIKTLLAAPAFIPVCSKVVQIATERNVKTPIDKTQFSLSESFIDRIILDLNAVTRQITPPSFISNPEYHRMLEEEFPPPHRPLPGSFPQTESSGHRHDARHNRASPVDYASKTPIDLSKLGPIQSILKKQQRDVKLSPKRLASSRAPKTVRFTETTYSPRPRTHSGHTIPKSVKKLDRSGRPRVHNWRNLPRPRSYNTPKQLRSTPRLDVTINDILAISSPKPLSISDDTRAGIEFQKEQVERQAAEEARKVAEAERQAAEEKARQELEARLARSGGLRVPCQPLVLPLAGEWQTRAQSTLHAAPNTTLAKTGEGVELRRHDFAKVVPATEWLNDEIVNGSLNWLDQAINSAAGIKDVKRTTRKCLAMSSFFFKRLQDQGVKQTQRTLRRFGVDKTNFLDVDTILLPICERSHWTLLVVRPSKRTIAHMDSLNPRGSNVYTNLALAWVKDVLDERYNANDWRLMRYDAPLQTNGHDCGVHTITNAMCIALGLSPIDAYGSDDMPRQRIRIASMLLNGGFKGDFDLRVF